MRILLLFASLITANEFFGENIQCLVQGATPSVVNTYCWAVYQGEETVATRPRMAMWLPLIIIGQVLNRIC